MQLQNQAQKSFLMKRPPTKQPINKAQIKKSTQISNQKRLKKKKLVTKLAKEWKEEWKYL